MDEVRLYEMYLREAIDEQRFSLLNKNENYKKLKDKFHKILEKYPNLELKDYKVNFENQLPKLKGK